MSKLNIDQQTIKELFENKKSDFLIPDYQRPYAWGEIECQTLWDDIFSFAFPENDYSKFDSENDEYFLGPIVTYKNQNKLEIIDGQQRLTTLTILLSLLRSFEECKVLVSWFDKSNLSYDHRHEADEAIRQLSENQQISGWKGCIIILQIRAETGFA